MKKRWIVLLLTVALVLGLAVFTMAAETETVIVGPRGEMYHCECGALWFDEVGNPTETGICMDGCSGENLTWIPLTGPVTDNGHDVLPYEAGNYYLANDITVTYPSYLSAEIRLDLNGHSIIRSDNKILQADNGGNIVITDTSKTANGSISTKSVTAAAQYGVVVSVESGGSVKLLKGTLDASSVSHTSLTGGAVCVQSGGSFDMYGGTIWGGSAQQGGSVAVKGTFTMHDGIITGGSTNTNHGGNVNIREGGAFTMNGGTITGGTAKGNGGAIAVVGTGSSSTAALTVNGGTIGSGTAATGSCIWVYDSTYSTVNISGAPSIAEIYLGGTNAKFTASNMDPSARIGLNCAFTVNSQISKGTVDAATIGCFYSTNSNYFVAHTGGAAIYMYPSSTDGSCICGADNRGGEHTKGCYYILNLFRTDVSTAAGISVDSLTSGASSRTYVRLTAGVTLSSALSWSKGHLIIDLNGQTLSTTAARMFTLSGSASLTITDTSVDKTGQVIYSSTSGSDGGIMNLADTAKLYVFGGTMDASAASIGYGAIARVGSPNARVYMHGGSVLGGKTTGSGGGAFSNAGVIYMTGGTITGGTHSGTDFGGGAIHSAGSVYMSGNATVYGGSTNSYGGAVLIRNGGTLSMTGNAQIIGGTATKNGGAVSTYDSQKATLLLSGNAVITGGTATANGGAVYVGSGCTMTISDDATITGGTAVNGGAIYMTGSTVTMDGGTITGSTVSNQGGAIYMTGSGCTLTTNGGTIVAGDNVTTCGGAVLVGGSATFTMNGGDITAAGKTAPYGTGVCVYGGTFNMYSGTLTGGTATTNGGGALYVASSGKVYMYGGTITGGTHTNTTGTTHGGGNVRVSSGCTMTMSGGTISGGNAGYNGGNVFVLGTFNMSGNAAISGGHSLRGGNVCVFVSSSSAGTFTMDGGTITGGTTSGTDAHGGNIHVREAGTFTMNAGTISNGTAAGNGGNIAMISTSTKVTINGGTISGGSAASGPSVWVHSGTTTGNLTVSGEPSINSVYLMTGKTITIGTDGLGDKAHIGVTMQEPGAFTAANTTNYATKFISLSGSYYVVYNAATKLELVAVNDYGTVVAIVGSTPFDTVQDAVNAVTDSQNQYVKVMKTASEALNIGKDLYLDLNGNTITGDVTVDDGYTLYVFDNTTDDYIVSADENDKYGKIVGTISGDYSADFVTPKTLFGHSYRYVAIDEGNNTYSFHRIYLGVKSVVLYPTTTAIDYKITLRCDEVVAAHIKEFGLQAYATAYQTAEEDSQVAVSPTQFGKVKDENSGTIVPYGKEGNENIHKVRITNVLKDGLTLEQQQLRAERYYFTVKAYIKLYDETEITSSSHTNSLEEAVKKTEELVSAGSISLNTNQKWALKQMYNAYTTLMEPWFEGIDNPVIPSMVTVAADYKVHCICGDENSTNNPCARAGHPDQAWEPWDGKSNITAGGNYYLTASVENYQLWLGAVSGTNGYTVNIDLYGNNFTAEAGYRAFGVGSDTVVNLTNSGTEGGVITGRYTTASDKGGAILAQTNSALSLYPNVTVDASAASVKYGGAIYTSGNLNIYGATVTGADLSATNYSEGGAIYMVGTEAAPVSMTMNSGTITGKSVYSGGGAVQLADYATLTMNGGNIDASGVTSAYGAAIRMETAKTYFNMHGGTLTGGTATGSGGGAISCAGTINMTGGTIQDGKYTGTSYGGGNIRINAGCTMTMTGGTISGGESGYRGGNVYVLGTFTMSGDSTISGGKTNGTNGHGGNIHVREGASFTMTDGVVSGGQVLGDFSDGGNIAVIGAETKATITGGTISDGSSTRTGPSVWLHTGTLSVSGTPVINDIYLPADKYITIGDNLSGGASIGVTLVGGEGRFTTADNATAANAVYFHSAYNSAELPYVCVGSDGLKLSAVNVYSVGYGAASIDPDLSDGNSYGLLGYGNHTSRTATAIESGNGLLATCVAVTDAQGDTVLLISIDAASITDSACSAVKTKITAATGVPAKNIMISAAHQHSTPVLETNYLTYFYNGIVSAAEAAMADRATVTGVNTSTVATTDASGAPQFGFVRNITLYKDGVFQGTWSPNHDARVYSYGYVENGVYKNYQYYLLGGHYGANVSYKICSTVAEAKATSGYAMCYESIVDSDLQLVKFTRSNADDVIMANFQVHPLLAATSTTTVITADVVGAFRNALAESTGADVMYFSGASGDINPTNTIGDTPYDKTAEEDEDIGDAHTQYGAALAALAQNASYSAVDTGDVSAVSKTLTLSANTNQDLDEANREAIIARAQEIFSVADNQYVDEWSESDKTNYGIYSKFHAKYIAERAALEEGATRSLTISVYSIGDIAFVASPYEMFCTNGEAIKAGSGFAMTFVATQANGDNGYIPSAAGYTNGGYSTDITRFAAGTGEQLVSEYLTLLSGLKTAE